MVGWKVFQFSDFWSTKDISMMYRQTNAQVRLKIKAYATNPMYSQLITPAKLSDNHWYIVHRNYQVSDIAIGPHNSLIEAIRWSKANKTVLS